MIREWKILKAKVGVLKSARQLSKGLVAEALLPQGVCSQYSLVGRTIRGMRFGEKRVHSAVEAMPVTREIKVDLR